MLLTINFLLGVVAVFLMLLVLKGQWMHVVATKKNGGLKKLSLWTPGDWMRLGIALFHIKGLARIGFYDVYRIGVTGERSNWVAISNSTFSLFAIAGSLAVLIALYRNIPDERRMHYNLITAPWYQDPAPIRFRNSD